MQTQVLEVTRATEPVTGSLSLARELVQFLEAGDAANADRVMQQLAQERESQLFREIGKLTRELHDALRNVELEARMAGLAENEIPDAKERLRYVIARTEDAANRTLSAVEASMPLAERIGADAAALATQWSRFRRREMKLADFRVMAEELMGFLDATQADTRALQTQLSDILLAQDFQDLTGQVIRRVIDLVQEVETNLVRMIRMSGAATVTTLRPQGGIAAEGPSLPGSIGTVNGQDEVDDLLSSLGF